MMQVIQVGLGPIGLRVTRALLESSRFQIAAALDSDLAKSGKTLGELAGTETTGVVVSNDMSRLDASIASVAVITTTSTLETMRPQILAAIAGGLNVVSTCEELSYPWQTAPEIAAEIDSAARKRGVTVLGTGINPGFLMDFLPVALSGVCLRVENVTVERVQNAAFRRLPFQKKIGAGLNLDEFAQRVAARTLRHVGLTESMHMIASRIGWQLDRTEDSIEPVVADRLVTTAEMRVEPGQALGVSQTGRGFVGRRQVVTLAFRATVGELESYDRIRLQGRPPIDLRIEGGVNGDIGTVAITVNSIPIVIAAPAGLHTMVDIPVISCVNG